jgi:hypothetical protein
VTHVSAATIYPTGTRSDPVLFETLDDALDFSRISQRLIWAAVRGGEHWVFRVYPGGRHERHAAKTLALTGTRFGA